MERIIPPKLRPGNRVHVIAPSHSLSIISEEVKSLATKRLNDLGLEVSFGKNAEMHDEFHSSPIADRLDDLHAAFVDPTVHAIFAVIGGYNSNQLIPHLDWELIRSNPKIFIGYSDTTALQNAMYAKTGLVTYSGPAYSTLGQRHYLDYTLEGLRACLMADAAFEYLPSSEWFDDEWYLDQEKRIPVPNEGWFVVNEGQAEGTLIGGNLSTFRLLQGTPYFPPLQGAILFLEDDEASSYAEFDRQLEALSQAPGFNGIRGLLLGRFQRKSNMDPLKLKRLLAVRQDRFQFPIIANVDFGHTNPMATLPIGGSVSLRAKEEGSAISVLIH